MHIKQTWLQIGTGAISLLIGIVVGWFLYAIPRVDAQNIPSKVSLRPVAEVQCGTYSAVSFMSLFSSNIDGFESEDETLSILAIDNQEEGRVAVIQGIKINFELSEVDIKGRGSLKKIELRDPDTGTVLASKSLSVAERKRKMFSIPLTLRQPLAINPLGPRLTRVVSVRLIADSSSFIQPEMKSRFVTLAVSVQGYKSANIWQNLTQPQNIATVRHWNRFSY